MMEWTTTRPKVEGWYWWRGGDPKRQRIVRVRNWSKKGALECWDLPHDLDFEDCGGEWSNQPIDPPREARKEA